MDMSRALSQMEYMAYRLRSLRDSGFSYTLDDLLDAMDRLPAKSGKGDHPSARVNDVLENLQVIVNRRARKAA